MQEQTDAAIAGADAILFLIDARRGRCRPTAHLPISCAAPASRRSWSPTSARAGQRRAGVLEAYELGLGEPVAISAEHGEGLADLYEALRAALPDATVPAADPEPADAEAKAAARRPGHQARSA